MEGRILSIAAKNGMLSELVALGPCLLTGLCGWMHGININAYGVRYSYSGLLISIKSQGSTLVEAGSTISCIRSG